MSFEIPGTGVPDELLCRYGQSKLTCRGPRRELDRPYLAFLGGGETFGRFVDRPFTALVEQGLNEPCVNLGTVNSGLDAYVHDPEILSIAAKARLAIIQVIGAQNLSNRYYRVHPRRNDRFLTASPVLMALYRDVDFTTIHFNKHLLSTLHAISPERFACVQDELKQAWLNRMRLLLRTLSHKPLLLFLHYPPEPSTILGPSPLLIGRDMLDDLGPDICGIIEIPVQHAQDSGELSQMQFDQMQAPAAAYMIGPATHRKIADQVTGSLRKTL